MLVLRRGFVCQRESGDGDAAAIGAVESVRVSVAHPVVSGQLACAPRDPGEDIGAAVVEVYEGGVRAGHAAH
jgi:hypothetical protein